MNAPTTRAVQVFAIIAAIAFGFAGYNMVSLRSVGGQTVAEAFYQYMGYFSFGLALLALAYAVSAEPRS